MDEGAPQITSGSSGSIVSRSQAASSQPVQKSDCKPAQEHDKNQAPTSFVSSIYIHNSINKSNPETFNVVESFKNSIKDEKQGKELISYIEANLGPKHLIATKLQSDPSIYRRRRTIFQRSQILCQHATV